LIFDLWLDVCGAVQLLTFIIVFQGGVSEAWRVSLFGMLLLSGPCPWPCIVIKETVVVVQKVWYGLLHRRDCFCSGVRLEGVSMERGGVIGLSWHGTRVIFL
jgi:hypothetical protein